jgi:hypothetical protein
MAWNGIGEEDEMSGVAVTLFMTLYAMVMTKVFMRNELADYEWAERTGIS